MSIHGDENKKLGLAKSDRVLVVDDEIHILQSLEALLGLNGYAVDTALGGVDACCYLESVQYDLVLLDLNMEGIDGFAVMDFIASKCIDVETVVVSGKTAFDDVRNALRKGASDFVKKPYSPEELFATIDSALNKKRLRNERDRFETHVSKSEALYRYIVDQSPDIVFLLDVDGLFTFSNSQIKTLLGYSPEQLVGLPFTQLIKRPNLDFLDFFARLSKGGHIEGLHNIEISLIHQTDQRQENIFDVTVFPVLTDIMGISGTVTQGKNGLGSDTDNKTNRDEFSGYYGTARDVTQSKNAEKVIHFQAYHDLLTRLPNRSLLNDRLEVAIAHSLRFGRQLAVLFLDLDRFKKINDSFGHSVGDMLLKAVSTRLQNCLRAGDTLSRFGGDEFVLLLPEVDGPTDVEQVAQKIIDTVQLPFDLENQKIFISVSIGIAFFPEFGGSPDELIKHADIAMYQAKINGKNSYAMFNQSMSAQISRSVTQENELHNAIENDEFRVFYQPQWCPKTQKMVGVEALLRWQHPERGLIYPGEFIALAEETRLIVKIGNWVLKRACQEVKGWMDQGIGPIRLAVNFSTLQIEQPNLVENVISTLQACNFPPENFELEITESVMMNDLEGTTLKLKTLAGSGLTIAIDDFGMGYSSLSYLHKLPIHTVKVDKSFVENILSLDHEIIIVNAICSMALGLRLNVVAEGVETQVQYDYLANLGCQLLQGYLISRPLSGDNFLALEQGKLQLKWSEVHGNNSQ
ncbi:MAG: diguanylate cyclase (GGDEF)-like protein [Paraglaciecola sp.]|jgi:diguanylate cyclase (GGDEF)-like protein